MHFLYDLPTANGGLSVGPGAPPDAPPMGLYLLHSQIITHANEFYILLKWMLLLWLVTFIYLSEDIKQEHNSVAQKHPLKLLGLASGLQGALSTKHNSSAAQLCSCST